MKPIIKKSLILLLCLGITAGGVGFRKELLALGIKAANFSAMYYLTDGRMWKGLLSAGQGFTVTPKGQENRMISNGEESSDSPLPPTPPEGVETGKVKTQTLPLSAANTVAGGVHISNKTDLNINLLDYLQQGLPFSLTNTKEPQVLIVHTHATERYLEGDYGYYISGASTRTTDNTKNTVTVGETLAKVLNQKGIVTLQDKTQHDYPDYTGSYTRSAQTIEKYLEQYPSIKVVIDLHRDAIGDDQDVKIKPTTTVNGKKAAQIMILAGCESGSVENFPNWRENFRFCLQLQKQLEQNYGNLARPLLFKACKYNFNLSSGSILVEVGTDANTLEEAEYSATLLGQALSQILSPIN